MCAGHFASYKEKEDRIIMTWLSILWSELKLVSAMFEIAYNLPYKQERLVQLVGFLFLQHVSRLGAPY